jgi:hypothetical protein
MATSSLQERLARTKRTQARALAGERGPVPVVPAANDARHDEVATLDAAPQAAFERASHLAEFEELLPVIARHYGYAEADIDFIRRAVAAATPAANLELMLCVRQWRIDIVTHRLEEQLPAGAAARAWVQFRQSVMGKSVDESGAVYPEDALQRPVEQLAAQGGEARRGARP